MSAEVKLSLLLDSCPVCSIPLDFLCVFKLARDVQMHAFTAGITDECRKNIKVESFVLIRYLKSTCVNNMLNRFKKTG